MSGKKKEFPKQSEKTIIIVSENKNGENDLLTPVESVINEGEETLERPQKRGRGRPSDYYNKVQPYLTDIERYIRCGVTEAQLCEYYKVGKTQWSRYKKVYSEFSETLFRGRLKFKENIVNRAFEVAMGYKYTEITTVEYIDGDGIPQKKTTTNERYAKPDAGMIQFLLINRFSEEYARDPQTLALRKKALELTKEGKAPPENWEGV